MHRKSDMRSRKSKQITAGADPGTVRGTAGSRKVRSPRARTRSIEIRREVLFAAATLFRDQGYKETTLRDIANALGMQAGSLYYHYSSKEEMLQAVLDEGISTIDQRVRSS